MREIKFRGKDTQTKQWVYGYYSACVEQGDNGGVEHLYRETATVLHYISDIEGNNYIVYPESVGQYTGLKDKNGKGIYEGDIVEVEYYSYIQPECSAIFEVKFEGLGFVLDFVKGQIYNSPYTEIIEVIGNIHDNPELLEVL